MNSISKIAALVAVSSTVAFAQQGEAVSAQEVQTGGLISKKYVTSGFNYVDAKDSATDARFVDLTVNVPLNTYVDIKSTFTHVWQEAASNVNDQYLDVNAVSYITEGSVKPFVQAGLGYLWTARNDEGLRWNAGVGVEYTLCEKAALTISGNYIDGFRRRTQDDAEFTGTAALNLWATKNIVVAAGATWYEQGTVSYGLSAGLKF